MLGSIPTFAPYITSENNPSGTISISSQFAFNPALITSIKAAKSSWEGSAINYGKAVEETSVNVRKLYYAIVLQEEVLKIKQETLESQKQRMIQAQYDYRNGLVPEIYLLQSQVTYENSKPEVEEAAMTLESSKRRFAMLLGLDDDQINLTDSIDQVDVETNEKMLLDGINRRYDIMALDKQSQTLALQKRALIEKTVVPSVVINASYQPTVGNVFKKWNTDSNKISDNGSVSVTVAWTISEMFPGSSSAGSYRELDSAIKKLEAGRILSVRNAKTEILNCIDSLEKSRNSVLAAERTINLAQKSYEMTLEAYRNGNADSLELKDAQSQLNQAKLGKLSNQYNYICALIDLEYASQQKIH